MIWDQREADRTIVIFSSSEFDGDTKGQDIVLEASISKPVILKES